MSNYRQMGFMILQIIFWVLFIVAFFFMYWGWVLFAYAFVLGVGIPISIIIFSPLRGVFQKPTSDIVSGIAEGLSLVIAYYVLSIWWQVPLYLPIMIVVVYIINQLSRYLHPSKGGNDEIYEMLGYLVVTLLFIALIVLR